MSQTFTHGDIQEIKDALKRLEDAIRGDATMGHDGLVARQTRTEARLTVIETERAAEAAERRGAKWVIGAGVTLAGMAGGLVSWIASTFGQGRAP